MQVIWALGSHIKYAIGIGLVTATVSELWFYPVDLSAESWLILLFYGLVSYPCLLLLSMRGNRELAAFFVVATIFGLLIEGIPVPQLYAKLPFTIFWTSIAWHAVITWLLFIHFLKLVTCHH